MSTEVILSTLDSILRTFFLAGWLFMFWVGYRWYKDWQAKQECLYCMDQCCQPYDQELDMPEGWGRLTPEMMDEIERGEWGKNNG